MTIPKFCILALSLSVVGCQYYQRPEPTEAKTALTEMESHYQTSDGKQATLPPPPAALPEELVQQHLNPMNFLDKSLAQPEKRFDVSANNISANLFFGSLVKNSALSVVVHPGVTGDITLSLKHVTLKEVLQLVEDMYGFDISLEDNILRVFPAGMRTETFSLNYLYLHRKGLSMTTVSGARLADSQSSESGNGNSSNNSNANNGDGQSGSNGTFIRSETDTDFWGELQHTLTAIIGETDGGREVVVSPQAGLITVRAYPNELRQVRHFLQTAETHLQRQVILEAKVLEVTLSDGYQQGIQWDNVLKTIRNTTLNFGTTAGTIGDTITNTLGGVTSLSVRGSNFNSVISLLDTQGDVDVLSSPRVTASNNQKAVIKVGKDEYFVTNVSSTTVASETPVTTPDVELTPFFSGIALDVTPQIDEKGNVLLHIHPSVVEVKEQIKRVSISNGSLELPLAQSEIRESDTIIKAQNGDVVVIGGLMKTESVEEVSKVPLLGDIPLIGEAFKNRKRIKNKTELVILLKPTVVTDATIWRKELERTRVLLNDWYPTQESTSNTHDEHQEPEVAE